MPIYSRTIPELTIFINTACVKGTVIKYYHSMQEPTRNRFNIRKNFYRDITTDSCSISKLPKSILPECP